MNDGFRVLYVENSLLFLIPIFISLIDRGLVESNVESFFEDVLVNDKPWAIGVPEVLTGSHVYVCAHGSRDVRCGTCGPVLIKNFNEEIELRGLKDQISVTACSHMGGHKYAGNIIIYSPGPDGKTMGHWLVHRLAYFHVKF